MTTWDINGSWAGEYCYDESPESPTPRPGVRFTLTAEKGWFGHVSGTVQDDPERGIPVPATIDGKVAGTRLTFQKQYPVFYVAGDDRPITLREFLGQQGVEIDEDVPPAPVRYRGDYDPEAMEIHGTWEIGPRRIVVRSGGQVLAMNAPGCTGTWWMRRQYR